MQVICAKTCAFCVDDTEPPVIVVNGKVLFVNNQLCQFSEYVELGKACPNFSLPSRLNGTQRAIYFLDKAHMQVQLLKIT